MSSADVIVIGAGQAGLAMSRRLAALEIDHVVLERGRVAERWRTSTWESLRLLTPNWMTRLPDWRYRGDDPHGYMSRDGLVRFLDRYARATSAPVVTGQTVKRLDGAPGRYRIETPGRTWFCRAVVIATGQCDHPRLPPAASDIHGDILQVHSSGYRRPEALPPGGVLVVGASASGAQIARELALAGRAVTLAVGQHAPLPRRYRGHDIFWWLSETGKLTEHVSAMRALAAARRQPSLQLIGRADGARVDIPALLGSGVRLTGRFLRADGTRVQLSGDLGTTMAQAAQRRRRVLDEIDAFARDRGLELPVEAAEAIAAPPLEPDPPTHLDLVAEGIGSIVWATGFCRRFPWVRLPIVGADGDLVHTEGITPSPGVFALGYRFLRRRNSNFIDGVGDDAAFLADRIADVLGAARRQAA